jgi:type II secretory pathway pseudopilin PulG
MRRSASSFQGERVQESFSGSPLLALTLVELLMTLMVLGVLAALMLAAIARAKTRAKEAHCTSNLKQIYSGLPL